MFRCRFLLDCSGRNAFLASGWGQRKKFAELDRTAIWTQMKGGELRGGLEEGLSLIIYIGGEKKGWVWIFPLGPNWITIGVVANNEYIRQQKTKFEKEGVQDWRMAYFRQYGSNFAMVGDAGTFIDPIFSSGVYLPMNSARLVSQALLKSLNCSPADRQSALDEAYKTVAGA